MKYANFPEYGVEYYNACTLQIDVRQEGKDKVSGYTRRIKEKNM